MSLEIVDRRGDGWLFAKIIRPRGQGRAFFKSLGTKNREEAQRIAREAKLEQIQLAAAADAITHDVWTTLLTGRKVRLCDAAEAYEEHRTIIGKASTTIVADQNTIDQFLRFHGDGFAHQTISTVEPRHIAEFINQPSKNALATRTKWLDLLKGWFAYCFDKRWLVSNPCVEVVVRIEGLTQEQLVSTPYVSLTDEEIARLLATIPVTDFWHGAVMLANTYGLRLGAIATLEEGNVVARRLRVFTRKGRKMVDEPLTDEIDTWLTQWRVVRPYSDGDKLFPAESVQHEVGQVSHLSRKFAAWMRRAGVTGDSKSFHSIRGSAAKRVWNEQLAVLGDRGQRAILELVSKHGMQRVQELLGHRPGSGVTAKSYLAT